MRRTEALGGGGGGAGGEEGRGGYVSRERKALYSTFRWEGVDILVT